MESMKAGLRLLEPGTSSFHWRVTHRFPLSEIDRAYEALRDKPRGFIKAAIEIP